MSITLEAVKFNHDPNYASNDALNIRKNANQFVSVPEWRRGISVNPEDSPAAYAIKETQGNTVTIKARFKRTDPEIQQLEVRAVDPTVDPPEPRGCLNFLIWLLRSILRALFGNVLGEVQARQITFQDNGWTNYETFELQNLRLWSAGVGIRTTTWRWQYRHGPSASWNNFATSSHRIYSLLEVPKAPWQQAPYSGTNTQLPWTEVLDYACRWAFLAGDRDSAATQITQNVYDLGPSVMEYDCPGGGSHHYAFPPGDPTSFDCTAFLELLGGGIGNGSLVNCTDCATIVSTFTNILGCDLWQSRMGYSFDLNPLLAIGSNTWEPACGWSGFNYHEVAWKGGCTADDEVFDACLQVDGDADPTSAPHTPLLPTNMRFGNPGDGQYRDRLATPAGRSNCNPQPGWRRHKTVV
ncbi:MAG: hypothetical protein R3300_13110 [Candidatus Promineifilaceae bacterium]|nr:hypothetical protein [Candidatus Promineifilaceae bacterium]